MGLIGGLDALLGFASVTVFPLIVNISYLSAFAYTTLQNPLNLFIALSFYLFNLLLNLIYEK